ncbi:6-bladed beta-propeller [Xylanibacter muris]|uniref:6-bladed beta-propeller n=1 Tax=Xylanibacter muris TaxID=2736290 RepID=A0ABX2AN61_9BACT|nr:6-bladed beta-propeller [Xylanibacter muris]NPD91630.1 6-bladed beta-propeller [Xylanibacter muris]
MNNKVKFLLNISFAAALCSCSVDRVVSVAHSVDVAKINIDSALKEKSVRMSSYFKAPKTIILETGPESAIGEVRSMEMFEGKIFVLDTKSQALFVFDGNGKYLHKIGRRGKGHGEYVDLSDFSIDRKNGIIYLWDEALDMAHKYNISDGGYVSSIKTERNGYNSYYMQYLDGRLFVNRTSLDVSGDNYMLKEIDCETGVQQASLLSAGSYNKGWNVPLRLPHSMFYSKNTDSPKYIEMFSDTIVSITPEGIVPSYVIQSKDFATAEEVARILEKRKEGDRNTDFAELYGKKRVFSFSQFVEFGNKICLKFYMGADRYYLLYDKKTKETVVTNMLVDDYIYENNFIPMDLCYSDEKGVIALLNSEYIHPFVKHIISEGLLDKNIDQYERLMNLTEESNPVLFYHELK